MRPELFELLGHKIYSYPLFYGLAWGYVTYFSFQLNQRIFHLRNFCYFWLGLFVSTWIGAKLLFIFVNYDSFFNSPLSFANWGSFMTGGGLVFFGGLIGGILYLFLISSIWPAFSFKKLEALIPYIVIGHAWGRIGCFLAGCCYGRKISIDHPLLPDRYPVPLLEAFFLIVIYFILRKFSEKKTYKNGMLLHLYLLLYSVVRFVLEFYRADNDRGIYGGFSTSQIVAIIFIIFVLGNELYQRKKIIRP